MKYSQIVFIIQCITFYIYLIVAACTFYKMYKTQRSQSIALPMVLNVIIIILMVVIATLDLTGN